MDATETQKLLSSDALAEAERVTGKSYKDDEMTGALGLALHIDRGAKIRSAMGAQFDTWWGMPYAQFTKVMVSLGFTAVLHEDHRRPDSHEVKGDDGEYLRNEDGTYVKEPDEREEHIDIWYHPDGILGFTNSYHGWYERDEPTVSGIKLWMNWEYTDDRSDVGMSGHVNMAEYPERKIFIANYGDIVGVRHNLGRMREYGSFLDHWVESPALSFHCQRLDFPEIKYEGYSNDDKDPYRVACFEADMRRWEALPPEVHDMVGNPKFLWAPRT